MVAQALRRIINGKVTKSSGKALFAFTARSLQQVSNLVITLLAARFLLPADYGIYSLAIVFIVLLQTMTYSGYYHFIVTSDEPDKEVLSTSFWMILGLSSIAAVLLMVAAWPLEWLFGAEELGMVVFLLALSQPLASFGAWASAALLREGRVTTNFSIMFCQNLVALIGGALLLWFWESLYALVAYRYLRVAAGAIMILAVGVRPPLRHFSKELARSSTTYSGGIYGSRFLSFMSRYAADLLLGLFYTTSEVGLYRFGNRVATGATDTLTQPMSSFAITQYGKVARTDRKFETVMRKFAGTLSLMTGMMAAVIVVFARDAIELFFNPAYLAALVVTFAMALRGVASTGNWLIEPTFAAVGKTGWILKYNLITSIATVVAVFAATPFGLEALAWSQAAVFLSTSVLAFYLIRKVANIPIAGAVRGFILGSALAFCYGLVLELARWEVLPLLELSDITKLICGLIFAVVIAPVVLFIGSLLRVFTLDVFSG